MSKMDQIETRAAEVRGDEIAIAGRILEWFDLLTKIRAAAGQGVDPALLVEQIKRIDPAMLDGAGSWLRQFIFERFEGEYGQLEKRRLSVKAASSRACPYTLEQYDAAVAKVGTKQELLAVELRVDRKTLRKYGRPDC